MTVVGQRPARADGRGFAAFGAALDEVRAIPDAGPDFTEIQRSADFQVLRRNIVRFVFPMSAGFLGWYLTYVLLSAYAHDFMSFKLVGLVNVGIVLGLLQFASTITITLLYSRYAKRNIDPQVRVVRTNAGLDGE